MAPQILYIFVETIRRSTPTAIRPQGLTSLRWYPCVGETAPESILSPGSRAILCGVAMNLAATPAVASRQLKRWQISRLDADEIQ